MRILLLAGEPSGMLYASELKKRLEAAGHAVRGYGDYGFATEDLAVFGFAAVLRKIFYFLRVKRTMERAIDDWRPDAVCTIDYPGLNLKLAAYAKARGVRAVHVVCPQVWAWHQDRIPKIEAALDRLCCFFPFEPGLFREGFAVFVGHPLWEQVARIKEQGASEARDPKLVALLPGSRKGEITRILPTLLEVAGEMKGVRFVVPAANERAREIIGEMVEGVAPTAVGGGALGNVTVQLGGAREVLRKARCAAVASGTATLEAALCGCPTVLVYRVSAALAWFARRVIKGTKYIGLANIVWDRAGGAGVPPMPELLQEDFTSEAVKRRLEELINDENAFKNAQNRLDSAMAKLAPDGDPMSRILAEIVKI